MGLVHRQRLPTRQTGASQNGNDADKHEEASKAPSRWTPSVGEIRRRITGRGLVCFSVGMLILMRFKDCLSSNYIHGENETIRVHPIMIQSGSLQFTNVTSLTLGEFPPHFIESRRNRFWINHEIHQHKEPEQVPEGCVAEADWMMDHHPSCNNVHSVDMNDFFFNPQRMTVRISNGHHHRQKFRLIGKGGFRTAFLFHESDGTRRVLKTLLYRDDRSFTPRTFDRMRRDAVASEQLTSSKYIVGISGYCGMSALVDYSDSDDMLSLFKKKETPTKDELFQIAHDVAQSVADAHHFNAEGRATIVHMDIKPNQWIKFDGRWMLNDFNVAKFLTWDPQKKRNCKFANGYSEGRWQAPEQFIGESPRSEKADTFSLGYVLNFLITGERPFPELNGRQVQDTVSNRTMWKITDRKILESTHPFDVNVRKAVKLCLVADPEKRPHAQKIADLLRKALDEYKNSKRSK